MSRAPSVGPTALAARTRLERARASCQQLMAELEIQQEDPVDLLRSPDREVVS